ncbi:pilus assembly protein TadG [Brevundimonas denitrificans]|uniref:Pilus assembly protein TadG n=1 Tax=Brevundimonas denitrificans TaxID=1443434 RepID=A0ABQ6BLT2_9CAUL|nr:ubiquitin-activating E1 FCCH domain-containing protein [Brevundimonas denitrificans]GLS02075.1 pilus assembly protein TadG [Brevundimonas denitrificans]
MGRRADSSILCGLKTFLRGLMTDARGNVAMLFGLSLPVLILMTVGGVDLHRASTVRVNLQDALDAATLAAARSPYSEDEDLQAVGMAALRANLKAYPDIILREADTTFSLNEDAVVVASSRVDVKALVANIFLPPYGKFMDDYLPVGAHSEVNRSSRNLEVALVLDITGSMAGSRITAMKAAARDLVDLVVQDVQEPYYTRMSVVPYSIGVNVGSWANAARGTPIGARNIAHMAWAAASARNISGITRASTGVVTTSTGHGLVSNDYVWIRNVDGMEEVNNRAYRVQRISSTRFSLQSWNGTSWVTVNTNGYDSYDDDGEVRKCLVSDCSVQVTAPGHGLADGEGVYITGANGMTQVNNRPYIVSNVTANTYTIGVNGAEWGAHTSGGSSWCGRDGCQWRVFRNISGNLRAQQISTCVTERTGAQAYTSAAPSTALVGRNYPATNAPCPSAVIRPLSSDKAAMKSLISSFNVTGSTAGHIGLAWGWYTVSPSFNALWSGNPAGVASPNELLKAVILMTDGEFNTNYCTGVLASDSGNGGERINCAATNGDPFDQAEELCDAMKAEGVMIFTVGLELASGGEAEDVMQYCATSPDHVYLPASGGDLSEAFAAIGRELTQLRISR